MSATSWRFVVTGSREWTDRDTLARALYAVDQAHPGVAVLVHGGCRTGADAMADEVWAAKVSEERIERFPVTGLEWGQFGKRAGPMRNQRMIDTDPELVLAFFQHSALNKGTTDCTRYAVQRGVSVCAYGQVPTEIWSHTGVTAK